VLKIVSLRRFDGLRDKAVLKVVSLRRLDGLREGTVNLEKSQDQKLR
jgi:hypothetical protein